MNYLDEKILDLKGKMQEKKRIKEKIQSMLKQRRDLNKRKKQLYEILKKEEADVERLEGMSFVNLYHSIMGDKTEKLQEEKEEALSAKLKYDSVSTELLALDKDIEREQMKVDNLINIEKDYEACIKEKQKKLMSSDGEISNILNKLYEEGVEAISKEKELKEAILAGEILLKSLYRVQEHLQSAGSWGTWDILGGGFIATMAKHSKIDDAKNEISIAQGHLRNFHRELSDVGTSINIDIEIGSFLTFADYFFDGLFADLTVQSRINDSKIRVENTVDDVDRILNKLRRKLKKSQIERKYIKDKENEIIENSSI